ncbi:hypothetical protein V5E97_18650 [Singulisphaera sp. Ch08]|uniref:Uncharacterized protein n=1 Tax=Singulisphaera sp. Ch08 TaxID=3120278 RepID=A0AAU7CSH5_9BACT
MPRTSPILGRPPQGKPEQNQPDKRQDPRDPDDPSVLLIVLDINVHAASYGHEKGRGQ